MPITAHIEKSTTLVGVVSGLAGGGLATFPQLVGPLIGLCNARHSRAVGLLDLALVPGLLWGRPRWPWLAARASVNLPLAVFALRQARGTNRVNNACVFAVAMTLATFDDVRSLRIMRRDWVRGQGPGKVGR